MELNKDNIITQGRLLKVARIADEWYEDINITDDIISLIKDTGQGIDLFTFWQRFPDTKPKFDYYHESDSIAVLTVTKYEKWWKETINAKTRNMIRKAEKKDVQIRVTSYDDELVNGMVDIFNETPIRQGRPFLHYRKSFDLIKKEFSKNIHREIIIGAYHEARLIGFVMMADAGPYAMLTQILSRIDQRDKAPNNALVAKAIEICAERNIPYLVYAKWVTGSLGKFKEHLGFQKVDLPRYYIPITLKGKILLKAGLHKGVIEKLPSVLIDKVKRYRQDYYFKKYDIYIPKKDPSKQ